MATPTHGTRRAAWRGKRKFLRRFFRGCDFALNGRDVFLRGQAEAAGVVQEGIFFAFLFVLRVQLDDCPFGDVLLIEPAITGDDVAFFWHKVLKKLRRACSGYMKTSLLGPAEARRAALEWISM